MSKSDPKTVAAHNASLTGSAEFTEASTPMPGELNPNHPVTMQFRELWFKLCAILVARGGATQTIITAEEIERWSARFPNHAVVMEPIGDQGRNVLLKIVTQAEGQRIAQKEGGLSA